MTCGTHREFGEAVFRWGFASPCVVEILYPERGDEKGNPALKLSLSCV